MNDPNKTTAIEELPYGIADYERIRRENYYYVDKTLFLSVMEASFLNHVQDAAVDFMQRNDDFLSVNRDLDYFNEKIKNSLSATDILSSLLFLCKGTQQELYVMIDEKFKKTIEKTHLIKIRLIFSGHELIDMAEMI